MEIRPLSPELTAGAQAFFRAIPEGERTFFKEDVLDEATVASWAHDQRARRLLAVDDDGGVIGYVAVIPGLGWSSHVGEVRLVVGTEHRRKGLGRELAHRALLAALELELSKVVVEVVATQVAPVEMFQQLGFEAEALLRDHVRDRDDQLQDLLVLSHRVDETWRAMVGAGIDEAVGESA